MRVDEDDSMPGLELWEPGEDVRLGDFVDGVVVVIDGAHIHIIRPKVWLYHLQWHVWWQNRHVKTANDGHEAEDGAIRSYQIMK